MISITLLVLTFVLVMKTSKDIDDFIHPGLVVGLICTGMFDLFLAIIITMALFTR